MMLIPAMILLGVSVILLSITAIKIVFTIVRGILEILWIIYRAMYPPKIELVPMDEFAAELAKANQQVQDLQKLLAEMTEPEPQPQRPRLVYSKEESHV